MNLSSLFTIINFSLFHLYFPILWLFYFYKWLHQKSLGKIFKVSIISYLAIVAVTVTCGGFLLYQRWSASQLYAYFLPPHSNYFYLVVLRTLMFHLIGVAIGLAIYFIIKLIVKLIKVDFISKQEIALLALGAVLAGWNNVVVYLCLIVILMLFSSIFINLFKHGRGKRVSLMPYVFLSLIIVLLIGYKLSVAFGIY